MINIKDYGAIGDGSTDDTAVFQAAVDYLESIGGGAIYMPEGSYKVTSVTFDYSSFPAGGGFELYGNGDSSEIYCPNINSADCLYILGETANLHGLHLHDFSMRGEGIAEDTGNAIRLRRCIFPQDIHSVNINRFGGGAAIKIESCWMSNIQSCWFQECNYGVYLTNDATPGSYGSTVNIKILGCHSQFHNLHGVYCPVITPGSQNIAHISLDTCIIEGNAGAGLNLYGVSHLEINNIYFESNNTADAGWADIYLGYCTFVDIIGCADHFASPPYNTLLVTYASNIFYVRQNSFYGTLDFTNAAQVTYQNMHKLPDVAPSGYFYYVPNGITREFASGDATPSVNAPDGVVCYTANLAPTTITNFDDGYVGQEIFVLVNDANTTFDFSGSYLNGNSGVDYVAASGDAIKALKWNNWHCIVIKKA